MDPITAAATITQLLGLFRQEQSAQKDLTHREFLEWLDQHRHEELKELITHNFRLSDEIDRLLREDQKQILQKLNDVNNIVVSILSRIEGLGAVVDIMAPGSGLPDDAIVERFVRNMRDEEEEEQKLVRAHAKERAMKAYWEELIEEIPAYDVFEAFDEERFQEVLKAIQKDGRYEILSEVYRKLLSAELKKPYPSFALVRRVLRNAGRYRIRSILPLLFKYLDKLVPLLREAVLYLLKVLTKDIATSYKEEFRQIVDSPRIQLPFVNTWIAALLRHPAFNTIELPPNYDRILTIRDRALIATRREDRTWVKDYKNGVDTLGPWDKRAVLYSGQILSRDEKQAWLKLAARRGDCLEAAVAKFAKR